MTILQHIESLLETPEPFRKWLTERADHWRAYGRQSLRCPLAQFLSSSTKREIWVYNEAIEYPHGSFKRVYQLPEWAARFSTDARTMNRDQALELLKVVTDGPHWLL
jgi:hypothetical protein